MASPVDASAPVAALAPDFPPPPPPPPLPEHSVSGTSETGAGVQGQSNLDAGVHGICQRALGVVNSGAHAGVLGEAWDGPGISGFSIAGDGAFGESRRNGVHGKTASGSDSGVWGENTGSGYGVAGSSAHGNGVIGLAAGVAPPAGVNNNGVIGVTNTATDSGVWGNNIGSGYGVAGTSAHGNGVIGLAAGAAPPAGVSNNGVIGVTNTATDSGVWGNNTGSGFGVAGSSTNGIGVLGQGSHLAGRFEGDVEVTGTLTQVGNGAINGNIIRATDLSAVGSLTVSGPSSFGSNLTMGSFGISY